MFVSAVNEASMLSKKASSFGAPPTINVRRGSELQPVINNGKKIVKSISNKDDFCML
jgi:hypothetical protein